MNRRTQWTIGITVIVLGAGVMGLAFFEEESSVRYVEDIQGDPGGHALGSFTLLGFPQPPVLTVVGADGSSMEQANPHYRNETRNVVAWQDDGVLYHSVHTVRVDGPDASGTSHWSLRNETRVAGQAETAFPITWSNWTIEGDHRVFLIQGFPDANGESPLIFGVFTGPLRDPMQPKPSQFEGHVMTSVDGVDVPSDALVYWVEEYTAGCSSKFIPPTVEEYGHGTNATYATNATY